MKLKDYDPSLEIVPRMKMKFSLEAMRPVARTGPFLSLSSDARPSFGVCAYTGKSIHAVVGAAVNRYGNLMPDRDPQTSRDFFRYSKKFIDRVIAKKANLHWDIRERDAWLAKYDGSRRKKLLEALTNPACDAISVLACFIKDETYMNCKMARAINSYNDETKAFLGPYVEALDKCLFASTSVAAKKYFIKGTNPRDRPALLKELFGDRPVSNTDFTSFEAHHTGVFARVAAYWVEACMKKMNVPEDVKQIVIRMMTSRNKLKFSNASIEIDEHLMSGALWTSSQNGLMNLLFMNFIATRAAARAGASEGELISNRDNYWIGLVEGDDGIFYAPSFLAADIDLLGLALKREDHPNFGRASFCGVVCDPASLTVMTDPNKFIAKMMFFTQQSQYFGKKKMIAQLRANAMSYKYNYGQCPVVGPLCDKILKATPGFKVDAAVDRLDTYHREMFNSMKLDSDWLKPFSQPTYATRKLCEDVFGVSVQTQLHLESEIEKMGSDWIIRYDPPLTPEQEHLRERYLVPTNLSSVMNNIIPTNEKFKTLDGYVKNGINALRKKRRALRRVPCTLPSRGTVEYWLLKWHREPPVKAAPRGAC